MSQLTPENTKKTYDLLLRLFIAHSLQNLFLVIAAAIFGGMSDHPIPPSSLTPFFAYGMLLSSIALIGLISRSKLSYFLVLFRCVHGLVIGLILLVPTLLGGYNGIADILVFMIGGPPVNTFVSVFLNLVGVLLTAWPLVLFITAIRFLKKNKQFFIT